MDRLEDAPQSSSYIEAKRAFKKTRVFQNTFTRFKVDVLTMLCQNYNIPVIGTGKRGQGKITKVDLVEAILKARGIQPSQRKK